MHTETRERAQSPSKENQKLVLLYGVPAEQYWGEGDLRNIKLLGSVGKYKWVPTNDQMADPLTKAKVDPTNLRRTLKTGYLKSPE